jgi:hypothetical protein
MANEVHEKKWMGINYLEYVYFGSKKQFLRSFKKIVII